MKYYKLYLQTKEGKFISAYSTEYSLEYELSKIIEIITQAHKEEN